MDKEKKDLLLHWIFYGFLSAFVVFLLIFNLTLQYSPPGDKQLGVVYEKARAVKIISDTMGPDIDMPEIQVGIQTIEYEVLTGEHAGKTVTAKNVVTRVDNKPAKVGTVMVLASFDGFASATVEEYSRENILYLLAFIFVALVAALGKKTGIKSILSLLFTLVCIIFLFVPLLIRGVSPIIAAILVVILSTAVTFIFVSGFQKKTYIAIASCIACTSIAGFLSYLIGLFANISSLNTPEAQDLVYLSARTSLNIHDLLFAGILIAAVGAVMDTSMSITSSVFEMRDLNPEITKAQLLRSGMNVGRDVMGTMTNTLILAFAGSSINIFVIHYMYQLQYLALVNLDMIVIQTVQGICGSIGVILSIPVSALLASGTVDLKRKMKATHQ